MFSGIGGFELGIGDKGNCVGYSEIDKYAIQVYEKHFKYKNYGDATKIKTEDLPDFDLLVGGFPCQSFSIAGKRGGFDDARGTLFFEIARVLRDKRPRNFLLENVKGLLSHEQGKTFQTILEVLTDLGYDVEWRVLNSKNYGVPQNRERVFIVGRLRGERRRQVLHIEEISKSYLKEITKGVSDAQKIYTTDCAKTLKGLGGGLGAKTGPYYIVAQRGRYNHDGTTSQRFEPRKDELTNTITSVQKDNLVNGVRRLTPIECERLQGFPDNWTEGVSDTQRYKCLGNAVTVNIVREIIKQLYG